MKENNLRPLRIVFLANLMHNPYANLLINSLRGKNTNVSIKDNHSIFLRRIMGNGIPDILHMHNLPEAFTAKKIKHLPIKNKEFARFLRFCIFIIQISFLKLIGIKMIWTVHEWNDKVGWGKIHHSWAKIIVKSLDALITHCSSTKNEIVNSLGVEYQEKIFVVPHVNYIEAYENHISSNEARSHLNIPCENTVFLFFGNLFQSKGILDIINVFIEIKDSHTSLIIAGQPIEENIESLIYQKIKGSDNIIFRPQSIPDNEVQMFMNAADCVVQPYKIFTTSGITILAMSFGKADIAPRVGYFDEVLDETGAFLYDPSDEKGLLKALQRAIEQKSKLAEMGENNLRKVKKWSGNFVSEETLKVYKSCLG
jgi:beta-1,4-mannosyltransferase